MIRLTRLNRAPLVLNSDLIEHVEATPDTVIALTNGQKIVVLESPEEIIRRIVDFRRLIAPDLHPQYRQEDSGSDGSPPNGVSKGVRQ